jgi:hypothetical protein
MLFKGKLIKLLDKLVITIQVITPAQFHKQTRILVENTSAASTVLHGSKI